LLNGIQEKCNGGIYVDFSGVIKIDKAIVHILNQDTGKQKLSEFTINTDPKLDNLIVKHITESIMHSSRKFAKFNSGSNVVRDSSIKILTDDNAFIEESKNISRELFKSMKGTNAPSANLLIIKYKQGMQNAVGVLKLDFDDSFHTEEIIEDGKIKIVVKVDGAGFNKRQKLQKCSFIYEDIIKDLDSNIVILDKQRQTNNEVSQYFGIKFLNCVLINDSKTNTKKMIKELAEFINKKYDKDIKNQMKKIYDLTSLFDSRDNFELSNVLDSLFENDDIKNEFKEKIKNTNIDYEFNIDKPTVNVKLKSRSIITDNGISLKGRASLFNNKDIDISKEYEDGYVDIIIRKVKITDNKF
jgi:hypothetical protein